MKKSWKIFITALVMSCILQPGMTRAAENADVYFEAVKSEHLLTGEISDIYQDKDGYIWIVYNNGLARYDGYNIEPCFLLSENAETLESLLHNIIEGDALNMYIGTERGLLMLDRATGKTTVLKDKSIDNINVSSMVKDSSGRIWIGGDKGLIMKKPFMDEFIPVNLNVGTRPLSDITSLLIDSSNNLWITSWYDGLFRYDLATGAFYAYEDECLDKAYTLYEDTNGNIWVGTWGKGLVEIKAGTYENQESMILSVYSHNPEDRNSLIDGVVYRIGEDSKGCIWIGCRNGLSIFDPMDPDSGFDNHYPGSKKGQLPYNRVNCILRTEDDAMFIGMVGEGICKVRQTEKDFSTLPMEKIQNTFNTSSVYSLVYEGDGKFWLGIFGHGPVLYDSRTENYVNYPDIHAFKGYSEAGTVEEIIFTRDSAVTCFANYEKGLWLYNRKTNSVKVINSMTSPKMNEDCLYSLCEDQCSNIWIGTRKGVFVLDTGNNLSTLSEYISSSNPNPPFKATDITCDSSGNIWIATSYDGIIRIDTTNRKIKKYDSNTSGTDSFISILADSQSSIWGGSSRNGLYRYDLKNDRFIKVEDLVFLEDMPIVNLSEDSHGRIWVSTQTSVASFRVTAENTFDEMRYWSLQDKSSPFFFNNNAATYCSGNDCMAFGTSKGVVLLPCMSEEKKGREKASIALTNVKPTGGRLVLDKEQTDFRINFTLFNYNNPHEDIYRYRLHKGGKIYEGSPWMIVNGMHNHASFHDLKPGEYTLEVYGSKCGSAINSDIVRLSVFIPCNPWKSWWAVCLYVLGGIILSGIILFSVVTRIKTLRREEINRINAERAEEVNLAKLQFFTNISYEFLSPLNIILAAVENLPSHNEQEKGLLNILSVNASKLSRLVQQALDFKSMGSDSQEIRIGEEYFADTPVLDLDEHVVKRDYTVLYVDSDDEYRQLLYLIFSKRFDVITCSNAEEAVRILGEKSVSLIVSEIMIPGMSGTELCSYIKSNIEYSHIPVILFTASRSDSASIEGYECGTDGYLTKQSSFSVLTAMIENFFMKQEKKSRDFRKQMVLEVPDIEYTSIDKTFLEKAIAVVNAHLSDSEFGLTLFAKEMSMSRTILTEKLKKLTGMTPGVFILNARLTTAYKTATSGNGNVRVSELAYSFGFSDPKYFSKRFKIKYGKSPKTVIEENTKPLAK